MPPHELVSHKGDHNIFLTVQAMTRGHERGAQRKGWHVSEQILMASERLTHLKRRGVLFFPNGCVFLKDDNEALFIS